MTGPRTSTSAWALFRHLDQGEQWSRSERIARELSAAHGDAPVHLARELVALQKDLSSDERLAAELLILASMLEVEHGSTRMRFDAATLTQRFGRLAATLNLERLGLTLPALGECASKLVAAGRLQAFIGRETDINPPFVVRNGWLHEGRLLAREKRLADMVMTRRVSMADATPDHGPRPVVPEYLTDEQADAVIAAVRQPLTLISGGPGTGKTSIIVAIIEAAISQGLAPDEICLAAPTGKAAWRMTDSIRQALARSSLGPEQEALLADGQTLHRLLGYSPSSGRYSHHQAHPLTTRLLIVDEASMIDTVLMERTFAATPPNAHLVLLGDSQQLPSVRAGSVFKSLTAACPELSTQLTHNFRMRADDPDGSRILQIAHTIRDGLPLQMDTLTSLEHVEALLWRGVEHLARLDKQAIARSWYERFWATDLDEEQSRSTQEDRNARFARMESSRLLCPMRRGPHGINEWNLQLHNIHAQATGRTARDRFIPGDPVMMSKNDYQKQLFNGDQGIIEAEVVDGIEYLSAIFRDGDDFRSFPVDGLEDDLELCYAMTVHKSQGSEFNTVGLILPEQDTSTLSRELLYTAVTRSRRSVVFLGDIEQINQAIGRPVERVSTLGELIPRGTLQQHNAQEDLT